MTKKQREMNIAENPLHHDTWKLLKKYRDVVWSLELSVQQVRNRFEIEYGSSIEDFLESVYLAGVDIAGGDIEHHVKCIERSHRMIKLLDSSVELLRNRHKNGETYYRRRQEAIEALSSILWGYSSKESMEILEKFVPETGSGT